MDIIMFFRDTLDGPVYIITVIIAIILLFACIGYLAEKSLNQKKKINSYQKIDDSTPSVPVEMPSVAVAPTPTVVAAPVVEPVSQSVSIAPNMYVPLTNTPVMPASTQPSQQVPASSIPAVPGNLITPDVSSAIPEIVADPNANQS